MLTVSDNSDHVRRDDDRSGTLLDAETPELHRVHLAKISANALQTANLVDELRRIPDRNLGHLQRVLKIRTGAPVAAVAQSVRARLARERESAVAQILHDVLIVGVSATTLTAELTEAELGALLCAEPADLTFLSDTTLRSVLGTVESFGLCPEARTACWASMVSSTHQGSTAALGWLVADPPKGWSDAQRGALRDSWQRVRARVPLLPEHPAPIQRLVDAVHDLPRPDALRPSDPDAGREPAPEPSGEQAPRSAEDPPVTFGDGASSLDLLRALVDRSDSVAETAEDVRLRGLPSLTRALEAGARPPDAEIDQLTRLRSDMSDLFREVALLTGPPAPATLADARSRLGNMIAEVAARSVLTRIQRLTRLAAPSFASVEVAQVGELADTVDADTDPSVLAGLDALVTAIEIGAGNAERSAEQARIVAGTLPQFSLLIVVASSGLLTFADDTTADDTTGEHTGPEHLTAGHRADGAGADGGDLVDRPTPAPHPPATSIEEVVAGLSLTLPEPAGPATVEPEPADDERTAKPTGAASPETGDDQAARARRLYTTLLHDQQYALASWLMSALAQPTTVIAVHRLAAHAAAMRTSTGSNAAAFADTVRDLDAAALHDRTDLQMLLYAASVRAGLLSPTAGAAGPLRDLMPRVVKAGPAVEELTEALLGAIYNGAHLTPRSADAVAEAAEAEATHDALARAARSMLRSAPSRTIRYQAATERWQAWMAPGGYLGEPLTIVAEGSRDAEQLGFVRTRIRDLRDKSHLAAILDQDTRRAGSARRNRRIEARARDKILDWAGDVTDLLTRWVTATENLTRPGAGTWMADPMADLRSRVNTVRDRALEQLLTRFRSGHDGHDAAVEAGLSMLTDSLALLDGSATLRGAEVPADRLIGGPLALAPDLPLAPTMEPGREVTVAHVAAAADALRAGADGWSSALHQRVARHDQVGAQILIELLRPVDPRLAQRLSAGRDRAVVVSTGQLDERVTSLISRIDADRRFGRMSEHQWADLSTRARAYTASARGLRRDFDTMLVDVDRLEEERAETVHETVTAARRQLDEHDVPDGVRARIASRIDDGDLTTANEYLETVRSRRELPTPYDDPRHLRLFHPAFPTLFAGATGGYRTSVLSELRRAIDEGRNPVEGRLADTLRTGEIDLGRIGRPKNAASRIGQWTTLSESKSLDAKLGSVKAVLEQLGFFVDTANTPGSRRGQSHGRSSWMHLTGVRATAGNALIPAFGSAISPSGDTLRVLGVWRAPTPQELVELLRKEPSDHSVIVLYFGALDVAARRELANEFRNGRKLPVTVVVDEAAFAYLVAQPEPGRDITMAITLPFTSATPFTPDVAGLVPQEMFYGRADERDKVVDMMGSCIVYGGRQLGKSALLRAAAREFDDHGNRHAIYQSIYRVGQANPVDAVWTTLWPKLAEKGIVPRDIPSGDVATALTRHVAGWIADQPGRQLLLLLDESDSFLDADATDGRFTHVTHFKELMESAGRAVKVVFAGLHQTARFERLANHPLAHFGDPVCVGPLAPQPAYDLLSRPLQALGYEFDDQDHASRVLALANNQPALIQLFGAQLLRNLQRTPMPPSGPPQRVTGTDVEAVWADGSLRNSFRKRFDWTLNLDPRYKVIAYSVAFHAHAYGASAALTPAQLRSECEQWWPRGFAAEDVRTGEFRALLDECVDLGVLSYAKGAYRLRTPNVLELLGSRDEVDEFLEQAESTPLPESFDGRLMRPAFGTGVTRGPLTSQQIADLLAARSQVRLVAGSAALTLERCVKALRDENENAASGSRRSHLRETTPTALRHACQQATLRAAGGHAVVLVDLTNAALSVAHEAWRTGRELIAAHSGGSLGIILITSPAQAPLWLTAAEESDASSGLTGLRRYDRTDLRLWLTDTTLPFQDDASRSELLAVTGGWPVTVNRIAEDLARDQDADTRVDPLRRLRGYLTDPVHADALVASSGVRGDEALAEAWQFLVTELADERADAQTVAELLTLHSESEEPGATALTPRRLAESGYRSTGGVVEVLRTLGLLVPCADDGQLLVEPVMATATRIAQR